MTLAHLVHVSLGKEGKITQHRVTNNPTNSTQNEISLSFKFIDFYFFYM